MAVDETRPVAWGTVLAGVLMAGIPGFIITFFSTLGGMLSYDEWHSKPLGILIAMIIPATILGLFYAFSRRRAPDFARGVLIGTCLIVLWAGICSSSMVGPMHWQ